MSECVNVLLLLSLSEEGVGRQEDYQAESGYAVFPVAFIARRLSLCRLGKCNVAIAITTPAIAMTITLCEDATITVYCEKSVPPLLPLPLLLCQSSYIIAETKARPSIAVKHFI